MKKTLRMASLAIVLGLTLLLLTASFVSAAPPLAFHMEVDELVFGSGEPFIASGPAVDAGIVCPTGTAEDIYGNASGPPDGDFRVIYIVKHFHCADGSGTFVIKMSVMLDLITGTTTARWHFAGGSGVYGGLRGTGTLTGTPSGPDTIFDVYDGSAQLIGAP